MISYQISNKMANASFVAASLVVFIHISIHLENGNLTWWFYQVVESGIARISVPFFFLASGYWLAGKFNEHGWWINECKKRIKSLILPYFIWSCLYGLYSCLLMASVNIFRGRTGMFTCQEAMIGYV